MIGSTDLGPLPGRANPIFLDGRLLPLATEQARQLKLRDGDIVQALVHTRSSDDLALLIRGRLLGLPASALPPGWLPGQTMSLQVQASAQGLVLLPLAAQAAPSLPAFFSRIGHLLFRPPGMGQLAALFKPGVLEALLQRSGQAELLAPWRGMQLSMAQLNPQALSQAMAAALGAEVWLARGQTPVDDPRQLLRRLLAALSREARADAAGAGDEDLLDAIGQLQCAVDDLEAAQVQAVQAQADRELLFCLVLPFADAEPVELQFRRARRQGDEPPPLTVNVHSRNEALGELWLKTQLLGGERVELTMWALSEAVVAQARARSSALGRQLAEAGLALQSFQIIHGPRNDLQADWRPSGRGLVVDISA